MLLIVICYLKLVGDRGAKSQASVSVYHDKSGIVFFTQVIAMNEGVKYRHMITITGEEARWIEPFAFGTQ